MSLNDPLANVLSAIDNATKVGKSSVTTNHSSSLVKRILSLMNENGYIGDVDEAVDSKGNELMISLIGKLNRCGVIKPRFAVKSVDMEKFEKRFLPAKGFGFIVVSTNQGLMTHFDAKEKGLGGKLISFCY